MLRDGKMSRYEEIIKRFDKILKTDNPVVADKKLISSAKNELMALKKENHELQYLLMAERRGQHI